MQSTRNMSIFLAFLILFYASFGFVVYWQLTHFATIIDAIHNHSLVVTKGTLTASRNIIRISRNVRDMLLVNDDAHRRRRLFEVEQDELDAEQNITLVLDRIDGEEGKVLVRKAIELIHEQKSLRERITNEIFASNIKNAESLARSDGNALMLQLEEVMAKISNYADSQSLAYHIESVMDLKRAKVVLLSAGLVVVIFSLTFAVVAWRSLRHSLRKSRETLQYAGKDRFNLAATFETPSPGEIGEALNAFFQKLSGLLNDLKQNHHEIDHKIADLAKGAKHITASLDSTEKKFAAILDKISSLLDIQHTSNNSFKLPFDLLTQIKGDIGLLTQLASTRDLLIEKIKMEKDPAVISEVVEAMRVHGVSMRGNFDRTVRSVDYVIELLTSLLHRLDELRSTTSANQQAMKEMQVLKENAALSEALARDVKNISQQIGQTLNKFTLAEESSLPVKNASDVDKPRQR